MMGGGLAWAEWLAFLGSIRKLWSIDSSLNQIESIWFMLELPIWR